MREEAGVRFTERTSALNSAGVKILSAITGRSKNRVLSDPVLDPLVDILDHAVLLGFVEDLVIQALVDLDLFVL
jgi:hypothetical protein